MNRLWAPWRIGYVANPKQEKGCLFCRAVQSKRDAKNLVIARTRHSVAMLNLYPYNNGHIMVAPQNHTPGLKRLSSTQLQDLWETVRRVQRLLEIVLKPEGFNIGCNIGKAAGAGFDQHLHIHIVPRWAGDTNFMPTLADAKIISQSLKQLYAELKRHAL